MQGDSGRAGGIDAICLVLRDFLNPAVEGSPDPVADLGAFHAARVLADLGVVERRLDRLRAAAGRVHSDMERGFIRAEIIPYEVFAEYGSEQAVKEAGRFRVEGQGYVVADGDIVYVRFNV